MHPFANASRLHKTLFVSPLLYEHGLSSPVDMFHLQAIIEHNAFGFPDLRDERNKAASGDKSGSEKLNTALGIFPVASMINHDCVGNTHSGHLGDLIIVRATQDIAKGAELFSHYMELLELNVSESNSYLKQNWGFECKCKLCVAHMDPSGQPDKRIEVMLQVKNWQTSLAESHHKVANAVKIRQGEMLLEKVKAAYNFQCLALKCLASAT